MDGEASCGGVQDGLEGSVGTDLLADLQAGLLDDHTAAALRRRARTDPAIAHQLATLDRVRRDLVALGSDATSAPDVPPEVTARVVAALRSQPPPTPAAAHGGRRVRFRTLAAAAGLIAVVAAGVVDTTMLVRDDSSRPGTDTAVSTVARSGGGVPLPDAQILALLTQSPDLDSLADPQRRASCLGALGYPSGTPVLAARPLDVRGRPGVLLVLPGDVPSRVDAVVVAPNCSSVDTGLLARTALARP